MAANPLPWLPTEEDRMIYERELSSFIPDRVFDAHTHVWHRDHAHYDGVPDDVDHSEYFRLMQALHPGRRTVYPRIQ
jgi:hypothetical protein